MPDPRQGLSVSNPSRSKRPYLIRAMHEWMGDNGHTPHIVIDASVDGCNSACRARQGWQDHFEYQPFGCTQSHTKQRCREFPGALQWNSVRRMGTGRVGTGDLCQRNRPGHDFFPMVRISPNHLMLRKTRISRAAAAHTSLSSNNEKGTGFIYSILVADCVVVEKIRYLFRCEEGKVRRGNPFETVVTLRGCFASLATTLVFFAVRASPNISPIKRQDPY